MEAIFDPDTGELFALNDGVFPADPSRSTLDLTQEQFDKMVSGEMIWDAATRTPVVDPTWAATQAEIDAASARNVSLREAIPILRAWADDAEATTATSGNAVQVLNVVVDRLGKFFDHFADLLENQIKDS